MSNPPPVHPGIPKREPDTSPERLSDIVRRHREEKGYYTAHHHDVQDLLALIRESTEMGYLARLRFAEKLEALDAGSDGGGGVE